MLSDESNKQHIREAIVAMERNNQNNYWETLGKVEYRICKFRTPRAQASSR